MKKKQPATAALAGLVIGAAALLSSFALTQEKENSGFMEDYSILKPMKGDGMELMYFPAGVEQAIAGYTKIMIDQPEIFVAPDSPYKGMKPDQAKALADSFRETLRKSFAEDYEIVEEVGDGVLFLRLGVTDLFLKRKVKFYNYTPIGAIGLGIKTAVVDNVAKKFSLIEVGIEAELYDSKTQKLLIAGVHHMGQAKDKAAGEKKDPTSWKELEASLDTMAEHLHCRLSNAKLPEDQRKDCYADEKAKEKKKD